MKKPKVHAIAWTMLILLACSIPGVDFPYDGISLDKVAHVLIFAGFGFLWMRVGSYRGQALLVFLVGVAYGVIIEFYQGYLPWKRIPDKADAIANAIGTAVGIAAWLVFHRRNRST